MLEPEERAFHIFGNKLTELAFTKSEMAVVKLELTLAVLMISSPCDYRVYGVERYQICHCYGKENHNQKCQRI